MRIIIDGDACPVKDIASKTAQSFNVEVIMVTNICHISEKNEKLKVMYVDNSSQSVDIVIINLVKSNDIVITDDYGLASLVLMQKGFCISSKGMIFDNNNIDRLLYTRHMNASIMKSGGRIKGPCKRTKDDDIRFIRELRKLIELSISSSLK